MGEVMETLTEHRISAADPVVLIIVVAFQFLSRWLEQLKKRGLATAEETRLRREIKELSKEASSLSQPATFAQAAKLRRMVTAKEKELAKRTVCKLSRSFRFMCFGDLLWADRFRQFFQLPDQELQGKELKGSYDLYLKVLFISKVLTYLALVCWFWRVPVASISQQLVQPFGKVISWRAGGVLNGNVMVGIIPWLILSTRVSKFVC